MSNHHHIERHSAARDFVHDAVIGLADGLTVPFALAAGLAGSVGSITVIVTAGLAEIAAGSIAMGLGGFLAAQGDVEHYESERKREEREIAEVPSEEAWEVVEILQEYGVTEEESRPILTALLRNPRAWANFMMRFELGLKRPDPRRAVFSAITIGLSYVAGGIIPLLPYMIIRYASRALVVSTVVTMVALAFFGAFKSRLSRIPIFPATVKTLVIGAAAAGAAYAIARLIS